MTTTDAATTRTLHENLGHGMTELVLKQLAPPGKTLPESDVSLGKQIDALIGAVVKAVLEGRQTNAQIRAKQQAARQAFARALKRRVDQLGRQG